MVFYFIFVKQLEIMAEKVIKKDIRDEIPDYLKEIERDLAWLQRKTEIPYSTLYSIFVQKTFGLNQERLDIINEVLETSFTLPIE